MQYIKQPDGTCHVNIEGEIFIRKVATPEQVEQVEKAYIEQTSPYLGKIASMNKKQFGDLSDLLMHFDFIIGRTPGQIPRRIFTFTPEFKVYEKKLWAEVNNWLAINKPTKKDL